jgi:hypothetical protein
LLTSVVHRFGNRYFENLNPEQEVPGAFFLFLVDLTRDFMKLGRHRWVDFAQVGRERALGAFMTEC